jgi:4-amino-4-deoxychorismate lyase
MSLLVESIKILNGRMHHIEGHEERANRSRLSLFGSVPPLNIRRSVALPAEFAKGLVKCRIIYDVVIHDIQFEQYNIKKIKSIKAVEGNTIQYPHKYLKRDELNALYEKRNGCDEIMILHNGQVSDAYYYNIVCSRQDKFYTPKIPLLHGVQRQKLLNAGRIQEMTICISDLKNFDSIHLINAMTPLGKIVIPIHQIEY